jgi:hypothetical protein
MEGEIPPPPIKKNDYEIILFVNQYNVVPYR